MRFEQLVLPHVDAAFNLARWLLRRREDADKARRHTEQRIFDMEASTEPAATAVGVLSFGSQRRIEQGVLCASGEFSTTSRTRIFHEKPSAERCHDATPHICVARRSDGMQLISVRFITSAVGIKKQNFSLYRSSTESLALRLHCARKRAATEPDLPLCERSTVSDSQRWYRELAEDVWDVDL